MAPALKAILSLTLYRTLSQSRMTALDTILTINPSLQHLFPTLGKDITERHYGADCRLYIRGEGINWPIIRETMDEFVIAHTVRSSHRLCACCGRIKHSYLLKPRRPP